jgi:hypothetical protein
LIKNGRFQLVYGQRQERVDTTAPRNRHDDVLSARDACSEIVGDVHAILRFGGRDYR